MTKDEVRELADAVLQPILGSDGFASSDVDPKQDHAGEESLYVTVHFRPGSRVADGLMLLAASVALQEALARNGEARYPYFRYDYPDEPPPFDQEEAYGARPDAAVS